MATFYVKSGSGAAVFANSFAYSSGNRMVPKTNDFGSNYGIARFWVWECTTAGTSAGSGNPTWPASVTQDVTTVTSGGATFTARRPGFSSGSTANWTFATIYLGYLFTGSFIAGGDTIYVSNNHSESGGEGSMYGSWTGVVMVLCVSDAAAPPTALATTGLVVQANDISVGHNDGVNKSTMYAYGLTFRSDSLIVKTGRFESCVFDQTAAFAANIRMDYQSVEVVWINCNVKFANTGTFIGGGGNTSSLRWEGGAMVAGSTTPSALFGRANDSLQFLASGVDLSGFGASMDLVAGGAFEGVSISQIFRDCKLPASWSGTLTSVNAETEGRVRMHNCDSGDTNYRLWIETPAGSIKQETTLVRTGGASDGATPIAWKFVTTAAAVYPGRLLESDEMMIWNDAVGSSKTVTVEILHDSATNLKDDEVWLEVLYLGTSGFPLGSYVDDAKADVFATAADQTSSSETWTTTGMSNPNKQKLSVTFTPQEKGVIIGVVKVAKASKTLYVDPKMAVS